MLFNSLHFICFFLIVTTLYFVIPNRYRWQLLLAASCYFYMTFLPVYILILGFTILIDYYAGIWIERSTDRRRRLYLVMSLLANIGVLAIFKYFNFLNDNLSVLLNQLGYLNQVPNLTILLPIGLSFHTFQAMSYTIEVYRGNQKAEKHFGIYALYVMFYPQLVAGPIERPQNILHQFYEDHKFDYESVTSGLRLMAWGFFKKVVIADRLALAVNAVYDNPTQFQGLPLIMATFFFAIQIYCDFSGYSDIAIGCARIMGFKLMSNFKLPYFSQSVSEFWKRWHISLSTWFRDYLYIPLGGNRVRIPRLYFNIMITFLVSGLWHGANWTYVIWGGINGLYIVIENVFQNTFAAVSLSAGRLSRMGIVRMSKIISTFCLISLSWIFFRAASISDAIYIIKNLFTNFRGSLPVVLSAKMGIDKFDSIVIIYGLTILFLVEFFQSKHSITYRLKLQNTTVRTMAYCFLVLSILLLGNFGSNQQFIYFQF